VNTTKAQSEILQGFKDLSKELNISFEIESHSETYSIYRLSYPYWVHGVFQIVCITIGDSTTLDMKIVSYDRDKRSYQIVPKNIQEPFIGYYNSNILPALNKALGKQVGENSTKANTSNKKDIASTSSNASAVSQSSVLKSPHLASKKTLHRRQSDSHKAKSSTPKVIKGGFRRSPLTYILIAWVVIILIFCGAIIKSQIPLSQCECHKFLSRKDLSYAVWQQSYNDCVKRYGFDAIENGYDCDD